MSADIIQARYDELVAIAARFGKQAEQCGDLDQRVRRCLQELQQDGWRGRGASAFFAEMDGEVVPAVQRLGAALVLARDVTLETLAILQAAEEEAARIFEDTGYGATASGSSNGFGLAAFGAALASGKGAVRLLEYNHKSRKTAFPRELGFRYGILNDSFASTLVNLQQGHGPLKISAGAKVELGAYGLAVDGSYGTKGGFSLGPRGEFYTAKVTTEQLFGSKQFGLTDELEVRGPGVEGFLGLKENSLGASIGGSLFSAERQVGFNIAGVNVGLSVEAGLKAEAGFQLGQKTKLKLPFFSFGISFGGAKDGKVE